MLRAMSIILSVGATVTLAACANDSILGSGAAEPTAALPAKPRFDPACTALADRIDALRKDGVVDRVEAASKGKSSTVSVKRASLTQIAELEKANADFQVKCSTVPRAPAAAAAPATKTAAAAPAKSNVGAVNPTAVIKPAVPAVKVGPGSAAPAEAKN